MISRQQFAQLTPTERQYILRRLKRGPALPKRELVEYAEKVRQEVMAKRKKAAH